MTTSSDTTPNSREGVKEEEWERDVIARTEVEEEFGPNGEETVYYVAIQDTDFENGWIRSSESRNLTKMA